MEPDECGDGMHVQYRSRGGFFWRGKAGGLQITEKARIAHNTQLHVFSSATADLFFATMHKTKRGCMGGGPVSISTTTYH